MDRTLSFMQCSANLFLECRSLLYLCGQAPALQSFFIIGYVRMTECISTDSLFRGKTVFGQDFLIDTVVFDRLQGSIEFVQQLESLWIALGHHDA